MSGNLYMIAGPIGNLEDMTSRAVRVLQEVAVVYAEDTRVTKKLLDHYSVTKPLRSFREQQPPQARERVVQDIISHLENEEDVAYLTDAGTPGVSDPGNYLVKVVREAGYCAVPIPGASALTALLSVSGLLVQRPLFVGFLPKKKGHQTLMRQLEDSLRQDICDAIILFESPARILKLLEEVKDWPDITVRIGRELTKHFEEVLAGTPAELLEIFHQKATIKGEFVVLLAKGS